MGHEITNTDRVFSVREQGWHGLATVLDHYPTREEAQQIAHPWEPETEPLYRQKVTITDDGVTTDHIESSDSVAVVRSDTREQIATISKTLTVVTNSELYDIAEAIEGDASDVRFETGGSLKGGRMVWLLLRLAEPLLVPGDPNGATIQYYGLQNSHDGTGSLRGQATNVRIICANTSHMADLDAQARGTEFAFSHTKSIKDRIEEAKLALAGWRESIEAWQRLSLHLIRTPVTPAQREIFLSEFVPMPVKGLVSDRVVGNVETARQAIRDILASRTCADIDLTAYGLVQASVEYGQHVRAARSAESRFKRAYLDRDRLVADAVTLAKEVATA
jgi:phage/plasmid-like protein (TIGR03299 family)